MARPINPEIVQFILDNVREHGGDIAFRVAQRFGVTRATASNYLSRLVEQGVLEAKGQTRAKTYALRPIVDEWGRVSVTPDTPDDLIWRTEIQPRIRDLRPNIIAICGYGVTEMFNNVIDHAGSKECLWWLMKTAKDIEIGIRDYGIGIFEKIKQDFGLEDDSQALLELSKGKLTSDPSKHSGEGIFFTSRMFDKYTLSSHNLHYTRELDDDNQYLIDVSRKRDSLEGTCIVMRIALDEDRNPADVFRKYEDDDAGFSKTHISVHLAKYGDDQLISRSQAKRLMARLDGFKEVMLDFQNVTSVGQGFADEVFRVFAATHPDVHITPVRANDEVRRMVSHVLAGPQASSPEQGLLL